MATVPNISTASLAPGLPDGDLQFWQFLLHQSPDFTQQRVLQAPRELPFPVPLALGVQLTAAPIPAQSDVLETGYLWLLSTPPQASSHQITIMPLSERSPDLSPAFLITLVEIPITSALSSGQSLPPILHTTARILFWKVKSDVSFIYKKYSVGSCLDQVQTLSMPSRLVSIQPYLTPAHITVTSTPPPWTLFYRNRSPRARLHTLSLSQLPAFCKHYPVGQWSSPPLLPSSHPHPRVSGRSNPNTCSPRQYGSVVWFQHHAIPQHTPWETL